RGAPWAKQSDGTGGVPARAGEVAARAGADEPGHRRRGRREVRNTRPRLPFVLLFASALPVAACAQQSGEAAEAAYREGRYEEAIRIGRGAYADDPADTTAHTALVRSLMEVGRYDEAADAAGELHNLRGEALRARGRLAEAEEAFQQALQ